MMLSVRECEHQIERERQLINPSLSSLKYACVIPIASLYILPLTLYTTSLVLELSNIGLFVLVKFICCEFRHDFIGPKKCIKSPVAFRNGVEKKMTEANETF